jgi:AefR-like transcriptional repressor, C-terminal domain
LRSPQLGQSRNASLAELDISIDLDFALGAALAIPNSSLSAGEEYLRHILSEDQLALYRVVARDAHRFPELQRRYFKEVVEQRVGAFADYLDRCGPEMGWSVSNKLAALATFAGLLKASLFDDALLGFRKPKDQEIVRQARAAAARILLEAGQF